MKVSYFYDNKQRFSAWFSFDHNTIVELCDRYSRQLICQIFKTNFRFTAEKLAGITSGSSFRNNPVISTARFYDRMKTGPMRHSTCYVSSSKCGC